MSEPSDILRQLAARGRKIRAEWIEQLESRRSIPKNVSLGVDVLDSFFDLSGYKRTASRVGRMLVEDTATQREKQLRQEFEDWATSVSTALRGISASRQRLPKKENSQLLVQRFIRTQGYARPETGLAHGVAFLEDLAEQHVVKNEDLENLAKVRSPSSSQVREKLVLTALDVLDVSEQQTLAVLRSAHPSAFEAIQGAMAVYTAGTPDSGRQALSSCRNALENLVRTLSGESDFSAGLRKLVGSDTRRKTVRQVYSFLSAYGTHGIASPSDTDVELGIRMTVSAVKSMVEWSDA